METVFNKVSPEPEGEKPKKCCCMRGKIIAAILAVLVIGAICCHIHHSRSKGVKNDVKVGTLFDMELGTECTVQFRRDALGGSTSPISPNTTTINRTDVSVNGTLIAVNNEAILLEYADYRDIMNDAPRLKRMWIPKNGILLIEYSKRKAE